MPGGPENKCHIVFWICILLECLFLQGIISAAVYNFTTSEYVETDVIVAAVVIGICVLLIVITITCFVLYIKNKRRHQNRYQSRYMTDQGKLSHLMRNLQNVYGSDCAICLERKESGHNTISGLSCQHTFHKNCIRRCLQTSETRTCPICRQSLLPVTQVSMESTIPPSIPQETVVSPLLPDISGKKMASPLISSSDKHLPMVVHEENEMGMDSTQLLLR